jgi:transposase
MTGLHWVQVSRIRSRFLAEGRAGLEDRLRSGRPKQITPKKISQVVAMTLKPPPKGLTHWSTRDIATRTGLAPSTIHQIWTEHHLKPHRITTFKFTTDPKAEEKILDVVGLYLNPPRNAVVLCLDEKTQIQALNRTQPILPLRPDLPARMTHDYKRNGVTSLFAALDIATGEVIGECRPRHTGRDFLAFLNRVVTAFPDEDLHVVLDNVSTHSTPEVREWLERHPNVNFHFTPTGASWMNMVEAWFSILTRKSIRRASFDTVRELVRHIKSYIRRWNQDSVPFVWTKSADEIIEKAVRC